MRLQVAGRGSQESAPGRGDIISLTMPARRDPGEEKQPPKTQKLNVWLLPEQIDWLKRDKDGPSSAVRALIVEAMNMENLARSVKGGRKKSRK